MSTSTQFSWKEEYNLGVEVIDKEHQQLFRIVNRLLAFQQDEKNSQWACQEGIKYFKTHAIQHFADEEAYMRSIHYEGLADHLRIHKDFRDVMLPALEQELNQSQYDPKAVGHFLGVCTGWLIGHTMTEDMAITGKRPRKWENLLPGEERDAMKKVILQLVFDMFQLESHIISDSYTGEKFGKGVYYRLVYSIPGQTQRQEIFMVFEDDLLINTVGKVLGIQTNKLADMLIHAARYTTRQFVGRVLEQLPTMDGCALQEENLLTYDEFSRIFDKGDLQVSLLFDTGAGYFAFCAIAPHLLKDSVVTPIAADNAMDEVERYLAQHKAEEKKQAADTRKKILVVDDSATIRQGMQQLLGEDYQLAQASSGVAAIRAVTLDRPDLVLLDYEMPVCDGRQTLEMLRSETEFAELPVIFLTSKRDPKSMIRVMPLKPAGHILKTSGFAELKKAVDAFFAGKNKK